MDTQSNSAAFEKCQEESIAFLASRYHAACGDARGTGKTRTAIHAADRVQSRSNLVVCPASVRSNWHYHIETHADHPGDWDVISYNAAISDLRSAHLRARYDVCIIDEEHFCKEVDSQRAQAVLGRGGLASRAKYIWPLSGTFAPNGRPVEYWPMLKALHPAFAQMSFGTYARLYCGMYFDGRENNVKGASRIDEFKAYLDQFIITHTTEQAFPGRQAPVVSRVGVDLDKTDLAKVAEEERNILTREVKLSPAAEDFSQMGDTATLRRLLGEAMAPRAAEFVREKLEGARKVAVFYQHTAVGAYLMKTLSQFQPVLIKGGMSDEQKDAAVKDFGADTDRRVAVLQQQSAGTGVDGLQRACSTAVFAEPDWTPGETEQRVGRLDRKGAEGELVTAYILFARGTLSETVLSVHDNKDKVRAKLQ